MIRKKVDGIIELYKKGLSIRGVAKQVNVSKTTINSYLHKKEIKLRKGNLKEIKKEAHKLTSEKAYLLGVIGPGDGYVSKNIKNKIYRIGLGVIDKEFVDYFRYCIKKIYGLEPSSYVRKPKRKQHNIRYVAELNSKLAFWDLGQYNASFYERNWRIPSAIKNSPEGLKSVYIRGIVDSQGHVDERNKYVLIASKNKEGLKEIQELLLSLGIISSIEKRGLVISSRRFLVVFDKKIGFVIHRKKEALRRMLKAYKMWVTPKKEVEKLIPKMVELKNKGIGVTNIGKELGISHSTVISRLKNIELEIK